MKRPLTRCLSRNSDGIAATEFALVLPVFLLLTLGGLELTNLALAHLRVSQMAMTVADNAGRVVAGIDEANIYEVFSGADIQANNMDFNTNGRIILSALEDNGRTGNEAGQMIRWQRCWGELPVAPAYGREDAGRTNNSLALGMGPATNRITASRTTPVMFVEAVYQYEPLFGSIILAAPVIRYESAFNVRSRQNNAISNTQRLPVNACS